MPPLFLFFTCMLLSLEDGVLVPGCMCTRFCFRNLKNIKALRKNLKKIGHKHTQVSTTREKFRQKITIFLLCAKKTNFWQKTYFFRSQLLSEICLIFTEQKNWYFLSKFYTSVRNLYMFLPIFFQICLIRFHIFQISKTKPGAGAPGHQNVILLYMS